MNRRWILRALAGRSALCAVGSHAEQAVLEVIELHYRNAEQIIPVLHPLIAPGGTLTGMNGKLIVRTTPANLAEIKQALAALDARPRRLLISVRQDADFEAATSGAQISGRARVGDKASVRVPGAPTPPGAAVSANGVQARVYNSQGIGSDHVSQQVQVLEGGQAFIRVGQSVPLVSEQVIDTRDGQHITHAAGYQNADTGFYVMAHVAGDHVTLQIWTTADALRAPAIGLVDVQQVSTTVSGPLGEWIEIGGMTQQATHADAEILARSSDARRGGRRVLLKVDEVH